MGLCDVGLRVGVHRRCGVGTKHTEYLGTRFFYYSLLALGGRRAIEAETEAAHSYTERQSPPLYGPGAAPGVRYLFLYSRAPKMVEPTRTLVAPSSIACS